MNGRICDNCGEVLALDSRNGNEAASGEDAAWIVVSAGGVSVDACTRSCATALLADEGPLRPIIDAHLEVISSIARTIAGDDDEDDEGGSVPETGEQQP